MATTAKKTMTDAERINLSDAPEVDLSKARRGPSRHAGKRLELPLAGVRTAVGKTQVDVAGASGIDQGDVSRLERRAIDGMEIGTLRKYLAAMGVALELVAVVGKTRIVIKSPEDG